jgi:hypothetical protein
MLLNHGIHLGYCTNIHRGESWEETWRGLRDYTLRVRERVAKGKSYGIGLRLSERAARELAQPCQLAEFQEWLEQNDCYVFTINGFPYGAFHGQRVKEQVFRPDWTTTERLDYTNLLFDILAKLLPKGMSGSVSTLPGSHKEFGIGGDELDAIFNNLQLCSQHIAEVSEATGHDLHLGLEPEPLGLFETSGETLKFFGLYLDAHPRDKNFFRTVGLNYDCCHLAIEFEEAAEALERITGAGIRLSKLHLSSALSFKPTPQNLERLRSFDEPVYFHQSIIRDGDLPLRRFRDIPEALAYARTHPHELGEEWRTHFHIPLHASPSEGFSDTKDHLSAALDWLAKKPASCSHLEMETYTWEVLPEAMRAGDVVDQLSAEYDWTLNEMKQRGLA